MKFVRFLYLLFTVAALVGFAQNFYAQTNMIGSPFITNYPQDTYGLSEKNFGIVQGQDNKMYFANDYALLQFDGHNWLAIGKPENQSELKSVGRMGQRLYVGGTSEIGYFVPRKNIGYSYKNLTSSIDDLDFTFNDVTEICVVDEEAFFLTNNGIVSILNDSISILGKGMKIKGMVPVKDELIFASSEALYTYNQGILQKNLTFPQFNGIEITFILPLNNESFLFGTRRKGIVLYNQNGLHQWHEQSNKRFKELQINQGIVYDKEFIVFGSLHGGLILTDYRGEIIKEYSEDNGLLDNNVLDIYKDDQRNLWVAVDGGISFIELNSSFTTLNKKDGLAGSVYCIAEYNNKLYAGSDRGLYVADWDSEQQNDIQFRLIQNTSGTCWNLYKFDNDLLLAHHDGLFEIEDETAHYIGGKGNWNIARSHRSSDIFYSGSYNGIDIIKKENGSYRLISKVKGFSETARELIVDHDENLWVSHGYKGIFKIGLEQDASAVKQVQVFDTLSGLPTMIFNNLIDIEYPYQLFGTQAGVYRYNDREHRMEPEPVFQNILGDETLIRQIKQTIDGDYLFIQGYDRIDQVGIIQLFEDGSFTKKETPFQKLKGNLIPANEDVYVEDDRYLIFGARDGLIIHDRFANTQNNYRHSTFINSISFPYLDSTLINVEEPKDERDESKPLSINVAEFKTLSFSYSSSFLESIPFTQYTSFVDGYDDDWQDWTYEAERNLSDLESGDYTFWVKSKNIYDVESSATSFRFRVPNAEWYKASTPLFIGFLILLAILCFVFYYMWRTLQFRNKEVQVARKALLHSKQKIDQFKLKKNGWKKEKEKLQDQLEVSTKRIELNENLLATMEQLTNRSGSNKPLLEVLNNYKSVQKELIHHTDLNQRVNQNDFLLKLKNAYPGLTARELKLCSYLRLNISSKETAEYLGISIRGVESLRYRLRKKLQLTKNQGLSDFILNI